MSAELHFISGKLGSGKTTLAKQIASESHAIFISEDVWLEKLYPNEITDLKSYLAFSKRFRDLIVNHVTDLLSHGVSVVFDFAGNVPSERQWVKMIFEKANVSHVLHFIDASDAKCIEQFQQRNRDKPEGSKHITLEEFNEISKYFIPPKTEEGFNLKIYKK